MNTIARAAAAARKASEEATGYCPAAEIDWPVVTRAVLQAIREPSEAMIEAAINQAEKCTAEWSASSSCVGEHCWQAMIDTSLSE